MKESIKKAAKESAKKRSKKVECINLITNEKINFNSISDCSKFIKINEAVISNNLIKKGFVIRNNFKITLIN